MFPIGSKVRVVDYPVPTGQSAPFDYNGLIGKVQKTERVGFGINSQPVYSYEVFFENVDIIKVKRTPDGKIVKTAAKGNALNYFEEVFLVSVA